MPATFQFLAHCGPRRFPCATFSSFRLAGGAGRLAGMGRVVITRPLAGDAPGILRCAGHDVVVRVGDQPPSPQELQQLLSDADAALTMLTDRVDAALLAACPRLRVAANMAVGFDNLDLAAGDAAGVWMTNTPGVLAETTADLTFGLLLAAARRIAESDRDTRAGGWDAWSPTAFLGADVHGAVLGIVGMGEIGTAMARRARGFGMRILYSGRAPKPAAESEFSATFLPLPDLLAQANFVSLHVPLTPATHHLIDRAALARMKPGAILVNTARGSVVDQDALIDALARGAIGGAALDVTDPEPLPLASPLFTFPNVVITPHIGSASVATRARMAEMAAENILAVLAGQRAPNALNNPPYPRGRAD